MRGKVVLSPLQNSSYVLRLQISTNNESHSALAADERRKALRSSSQRRGAEIARDTVIAHSTAQGGDVKVVQDVYWLPTRLEPRRAVRQTPLHTLQASSGSSWSVHGVYPAMGHRPK